MNAQQTVSKIVEVLRLNKSGATSKQIALATRIHVKEVASVCKAVPGIYVDAWERRYGQWLPVWALADALPVDAPKPEGSKTDE